MAIGTTPGVSYTPSTFDYARRWDQRLRELQAQGASQAQIDQEFQQYSQAAQQAYPAWRAANVDQHFWQHPAFWATLPAAAYGAGTLLGAPGFGASAASPTPTLEGVAAGPGASTVPVSGVAAGTSGTSAATDAAWVPTDWAAGSGAGASAAGSGAADWVPTDWAAGSTAATSPSWLRGVGRALSDPYAIAGLAGAGASIWGTHAAASANEAAAQAQLQATREALQYEKERDAYLQQLEQGRYRDVQSAVNPSLASGQSAQSALLAGLGLSPVTVPVSTPPPPQTVSYPSYATRTGLNTNQPPVGTAIPRPGGPLPNPNTGMPNYPSAPTPVAGAAVPRSSAQSVRLRAPDGTIGYVTPDQLAHYQALGATIA